MATASTIINMASKEIGVKETGVNNVKYNTEYYGRAVNGENYPWCAVFVWWVFKHAGASALFCFIGNCSYGALLNERCPPVGGHTKRTVVV